LLALLDEATEHPLALIAAPAGFGKSTLVSVWLRERGRPGAWLSIDQNDNDAARFLAYFVRALQPVVAGVGTSVLAALGPVQPPEVRAHVNQLINELSAAPGPVTLVLDDWHLIDDDQATLALQTLVEYQPPQLHLIIITREDPPLPLARLRSRGQLGEVRAADLRFTAAEAAEFLHQHTRLEMTDAEVATLEQRTEGWIAGLHLAALAMRGTGDPAAFIEAFTGSHRYVLDYLLEEVFARQPAELQAFLLDTAWLERMSGDLCDAVLGRAGSATLLEQIEAAGLFLKSLDETHQWYRYHRLFAEALQARHRRLAPQRAAEIQRRAAGWFEAAGWLVEAVEHARRSGDMAYYASLLEKHTFVVMGQGEVALAARWLAALPELSIHQSPRLCLDHAWVLYLNRQYDLVITWLEAAEAHLAGAGERETGLRGEILALRSLLEQADAERALRLGQEAVAATPASNALVRGLIQMALANGYSRLGHLEQAIDAFEAAIPLHWEAGNLLAVFIAANDVVLLARPLGRLDRAEALCQQLLARARRSGLAETPAAGVAYLGLASVRMERGQWEAAGDMLRQALERGARSGLRGGLRSDVLARQVESGLERVGRGPPAGQSLAPSDFEVDDLAASPPPTISRLANLWIEQGRLDQARPLLQHLAATVGSGLRPEHLEWRLSRVYYQVMLGLRRRDPATLRAAEAEAAALAEAAESLGWAGYLSEILVLRALAEYTRRDLAAALADLDRALALAERDGQVMLFVGKGRTMAELLAEALRQDVPHASYAQAVLERFPSPPAPLPPASQPGLAETLTEREIEVLRLMADGLTYDAIAQRLFVSVNTVRYHVKGLYGKLGAGSRADAIARGRELRLV
jgi:LuxR family maltose regulon positive regulatory protein